MILLAVVSARAQLVIGVQDPSGAVIPGARVSVKQVGCQCGQCPSELANCPSQCCDCRSTPCNCCIATLTGVTGDNGTVTFELSPGSYKAQIDAPHFKPTTVENIQVTVGQSSSVQVTLEVGPVSQAVEVVSAATGGTPQLKHNFQTAKTLTVQVENVAASASVTVRVRRLGCRCGECPAELKECPSRCCDCRKGDCVCCIDTSVSVLNGLRSFSVAPGEYEVSIKRGDVLFGTLSGVTVRPHEKEVKLLVNLVEGPLPK